MVMQALTDTVVEFGCWTVIETCPVPFPAVAVTSVVPAPVAVTRPAGETVATAAVWDIHVTGALRGPPVDVNTASCVVSPGVKSVDPVTRTVRAIGTVGAVVGH
jgi:hypothetical protein